MIEIVQAAAICLLALTCILQGLNLRWTTKRILRLEQRLAKVDVDLVTLAFRTSHRR